MTSAGFIIENMIEQTDEKTLQMTGKLMIDQGKHKDFHYLLFFKARKA